MSVKRKHWEEEYGDEAVLPSWQCPQCKEGTLSEQRSRRLVLEPQYSKDAYSHDAWDPSWLSHVFSTVLTCQKSDCGEHVILSGTMRSEEGWDGSSKTIGVDSFLRPKASVPPLAVITLHDEYPDAVRVKLLNASAQVWMDISSSANHLRQAVEAILDTMNIRKTFISKGKRVRITTHSRIELFKVKHKADAELLMAIKWLGNAGSHNDVISISREDLLRSFEIIEEVLDNLFIQSRTKIVRAAKKIIARKGRPHRKKVRGIT